VVSLQKYSATSPCREQTPSAGIEEKKKRKTPPAHITPLAHAHHTMAWARFFALPGEAPEREVLISITISHKI
jgi:hypothetical protein